MPLKIIRNDITKMDTDAIVNAANESLLGGGGVDGCIHRAAGAELLKECMTLGGCKTGSAKITGAYNLPCKYVIHTVGPRWRGGDRGERELLISCYRSSLELAKEHGCESVAFPLISAGIYGYPKDKALRIAVGTIAEFLADNDMTVYIVVFDKDSFKISEKLFDNISEYIGDRYAEQHSESRSKRLRELRGIHEDDSRFYKSSLSPKKTKPAAHSAPKADRLLSIAPKSPDKSLPGNPEELHGIEEEDFCFYECPESSVYSAPAAKYSLDDALKKLDESFSEMLLRKIDESGMTDSQCYKKANVDRKLFSKIRTDRLYRPSKPTAIAFAIALELDLEQTKEMLMKAGFALSHSSKFDIIIEYFIENGNYNIFEINEALFAFDQNLLGA